MEQKLYCAQTENSRRLVIKTWPSDNPPGDDACDAVLSYSIFDAQTKKYLDGGELDYKTGAYPSGEPSMADISEYIGMDGYGRIVFIAASDEDPEDWIED